MSAAVKQHNTIISTRCPITTVGVVSLGYSLEEVPVVSGWEPPVGHLKRLLTQLNENVKVRMG